ncbi:oligosaccharide flippase family protein [Candidatus Gracilibacteria bacterium]|nr:oligosaccharide flippase family protein [Candidatus Gracilibacteria bacterium]
MATKKIYSNTIAQIAGKLITALISIFMIKILTNYLDISGYGLYSKIYNYVSIFAVIADLGLYTISVRELANQQHDRKMTEKISGNILSLRTLSGLIIVFLSLAIGLFLPGYNTPEALIGISIAALFTLAGLINSSLMSSLQAMLKTEFSLVANTAGKLLTFGMVVLFASVLYAVGHTEKFILVMLAGLAGNILMTVITWWYVEKYEKIRFRWDSSYIKHILKISLPYGLALFLNVLFFKVDTLLLSIMTEKSVSEIVVALYALPMKIVEVGMMYGTIFLNSLLPVLTKSITEKNTTETHRLTIQSFRLLFFFGTGITIFLFLCSPDIIRLISNSEYVHTNVYGYFSSDALKIVSCIFFFYFLSSLFTFILIAANEQKKMLVINACIALVNIIGNLIFIPHFSFIGSAWVTLISQAILMFITGYTIRKQIPLKQVCISGISILFCAILGVLGVFLLESFFPISEGSSLAESLTRILATGGIFCIIYLVCVGILYLYKKK